MSFKILLTEFAFPCTKPYAAILQIRNEQGIVIAEPKSDDDGFFRVLLPPGAYIITKASSSMYPRRGPIAITVNPGVMIMVEIAFDSGIR